MSVVAGTQGSVVFTTANEGYAVKVQSWTLDIEGDSIDVTGWTDYDGTDAAGRATDWDVRVGGRKRWSGSYTAVFDSATAPYSSTTPLGDTTLGTAAAEFYVDNNASATDGKFAGEIIITGISASNEISGVASITFTFDGSGPLTFTAQT